MELCSINVPAGINGNCLTFEKPVKNIVITGPDESFSSLSDLMNLSSWKTKVQTLLAWLPASLASYENTTDDPTINSTAFGQKVFVRSGVPSMTTYLNSNPCDFNELLWKLTGGNYGVWFILEDGSIVAQAMSDGTFKGFTAQVNASTKGIPIPDSIENSYPAYFGFTNYEQFEQRRFIKPEWNVFNELKSAMPVGLGMSIKTPYVVATGLVIVNVGERCGDVKTGLVAGDFEVVSSNALDTPIVASIVDNTDGTYDVELHKDSSPVPMVAGDYMVIRVKVEVASVVTYVSNNLYVQA